MSSRIIVNSIRHTGASGDGVTLNSDGTVAVPNELTLSSNKHVVIPAGTTAQRDSSPPSYSLRYNTTLGELEFWDGSNWNTINQTKAWNLDNTATHWWKSEGIASNSSWVAEKGGANFGLGNNTSTITYTASDSDFNNNKTLYFNANADFGGYSYLETANSDNTYWDPPEPFSVIMVIEKKDQSPNTTFGDSLFVQGYNQTTNGSWAIDLSGDHTWGNGYGEAVGGISGYSNSSDNYGGGSSPKKGIFCFRVGTNGADMNWMWQESGQSSFTTIASASSLPSSLPTSGFDYLSIGNFKTTSSNHEWKGRIAEIAYYKGIRVSDDELARFSTYAKAKFNV